MPAFDESFDYLTMLGLNPATMPLDPAGLGEVVKRRKKEWTAQAINPLYQQEARSNLEKARQFEQLARDPAALEAYVKYLREVQAANRQQQEQEIGALVALAAAGTGATRPGSRAGGEQKRELTVAQRELILKEAETRRIPADVVDSVIRAQGLTVAEGPAAATAARLPYKQPALDRTLLMQINNSLRVLGKQSFYELLDLPVRTSPARIASVAQLLYGRWSKALPKTTECIAWEKSLQSCLTYLKDEEGKSAYDRALYNERLDDFVQRIDLVLASGRFLRDAHVLLAQVGVREYGLSNNIVNQCINVRAASQGVPLSKPVAVTVQMEGQVQCARCFRWNPARNGRCAACGSGLARKCLNPTCGHLLPVDAKLCEHCQLPASRGGQYLELLRLIDASLAAGNFRSALDACRIAQQILPSQELDERGTRAGRIRVLSASVKRAVAGKQWTKVYDELSRLLVLAPHISQPGIPQLEEVAQYIAQMRKRIEQSPQGTSPVDAARFHLEILAQWTDSAEAVQHLSVLADELEAHEEFEAALEIAHQLAAVQPLNEEFQVRAVRIGNKASQSRERDGRREEALITWRRALADHRLYAAERALQTLVELAATGEVAAEVTKFRARLALVRTEVQEIKQLASATDERDLVITRWVSLLERCRDCREALAALQSASPDPPASPQNVRVTLNGNRRTIAWDAPGTGRQPTGYIVQRLVARPGVRQNEAPWFTIYEGPSLHCLDDEIAHNGTILRYSVQAAMRGRLEVEGHVLREFAVDSPPLFAEPLLVWQEVLGLRVHRLPEGLELRWHHPAGARQVLIERWPGGREAIPERPETLPVTSEGRLLDTGAAIGQINSYRLKCVYDGPQGDFVTPGVIVTNAAATTPALPPKPQNESQDAAALADVIQRAPSDSSETIKEDGGPLKRFGLWPPVKN